MVTLDQAGMDPGVIYDVSQRPSLGSLVESIAVLRPCTAGAAATAWRIVADDAPHILLHYEERASATTYHVVVVGARRVFADVDKSRRILTVAVRLRPGALPALFGFPAHELTDNAYALETVLASRARSALGRLTEEAVDAPFCSMATFMGVLVQRARPIDRRVLGLSRAAGTDCMEVATAARIAGMSSRGLRRLTWQEAGLSPKRLMRIRRLHRALTFALTRTPRSWTTAAFEAGYSDQAHFIRECRALLGETPSTFARRRG